ncbi:hypothetical protein EN766_28560 [Mesorhizobium sp. M2A.F.Ca.ET.046.02.1.1]|nr:hypothetical protein EN766_28560 [Mesorhizobium sp. M2A.F.Ca.ET.046.02.1.1]
MIEDHTQKVTPIGIAGGRAAAKLLDRGRKGQSKLVRRKSSLIKVLRVIGDAAYDFGNAIYHLLRWRPPMATWCSFFTSH